MYYLMWKILTGLHDSIKISFLPVGHATFSPYWCFGLLKRQYGRTKVGCLDDIVAAINISASIAILSLLVPRMVHHSFPCTIGVNFLKSTPLKQP